MGVTDRCSRQSYKETEGSRDVGAITYRTADVVRRGLDISAERFRRRSGLLDRKRLCASRLFGDDLTVPKAHAVFFIEARTMEVQGVDQSINPASPFVL